MTYRQFMDRVMSPALARSLGPLLPRLVTARLLQRLGNYLVVCSEPSPADAIVVLGGGSRRRLDWALELYRRGLAPRVVLTSSVHSTQLIGTSARNSFEAITQQGVPAQAVTWLPWPRNTLEEAKAMAELCAEQGLARLLVVTEAFHSRRAWHTFHRVVGARGGEILLTCPPRSSEQVVRWWERHRSLEGVLGELAALAYYRMRYGV